jgi:hypothetical protein
LNEGQVLKLAGVLTQSYMLMKTEILNRATQIHPLNLREVSIPWIPGLVTDKGVLEATPCNDSELYPFAKA